MPNKKSAKKELRKNIKRAAANDFVHKEIKELSKAARKQISEKAEVAKETVLKTVKALDKAARKGVIKKNTAARKKSRLTKALNKASK